MWLGVAIKVFLNSPLLREEARAPLGTLRKPWRRH
jgi:hypothetical protein